MDYLGEVFALGMDAVIFAVCLRQYVYYKNAVKAIKDVEIHEVGPNLDTLLANEPGNKRYVGVRGVVRPLGEPLKSINKSDVTGVIQKLTIQEHVVARTSAGFWSDEQRIIQTIYNVVPFVLQKDWYSVEVIDPLSADVLNLDVISDHFEPTVPTLVDHIWGFFTGIRQRGLQSTEKMLREDSVITVVGELSSSETKSNFLTLQLPLNGSPFCITSMSVTALIRKLDNRTKVYRILCLMCGTVGLLFGGIVARRYWKNKQEQRLAEELRQSLEASRQERRQRVRDSDLREDQICVVCKTNAREIILLPCGHVCICEDCSASINNNCPICRTQITQKAAAYIV
ncbi:hypothetical protein DMN91_003756 [Ooceraea biroi]|uniref:RING-type E3 ubiquitin transferase n=1 Tax=Ooceraea biroi TaxID=2015173 RepID=A0A026X286_OOCBI|nr:mitochondrial E3 ubiquitin protein ligase 1 [Ooceraea biroi]EZA62430.1 Mitochondrial ubiquitin ligase activator of nfkb 1-A [Ooceraea biroi]RLU23551.1 hypothetical protein DMN91_003756 [Ooceraea biroi]